MKKILCFGDSNTWGCSPVDNSRYDEKTRWPMVMQSLLGKNYTIIEDGLNGRTALNLSPMCKNANGIDYISTVLKNYIPIDIVIISLGLNDVFAAEEVSAESITRGIQNIVYIIRESHSKKKFRNPEIIIMPPPKFNKGIDGADFFELQINKLECLPEFYKEFSSQHDCHFFDASKYVTLSIIDGYHLDAGSHILLGKKITEFTLSRLK